MKKIKDFVCAHFNFSVPAVTWLAIAAALAIAPSVMFMPEKWGWENNVLENIQMVILFIGLYFSLKVDSNKKFFNFVAMVLVIIMLREVNCGRTLFFSVPGTENTFYSWKEIKYGYLAHPIYGAYMTWVGIYFLKNKLWKNLWDIVRKIKFPFWNILLMLLGMALGTYAEHATHNFVFEEIAELLFYVALIGIIYLYTRDDRFKLDACNAQQSDTQNN